VFKFKKSIIETVRFSNYTDRSNNILNLDRNEKVQSLTNLHKKKLNKYFNKLNLNLYPNLKETYKKLSKYIRCKIDNILITEGVSGAIKNILDSTYIDRKIEIIVPKPSFALYEIYSKIYNFKVKTYTYGNDYTLNLQNIFKLTSKNTSIVFITFPNIPVEGEIKLSAIVELVKFLNKKKILLVVDEVYYPFNKSSAIKLVKRYKNIVIMRSFSKAFGLAGARIGYMISNSANIKKISKSKGGYETNMLSAQAMNYMLDNTKITKRYVNDVRMGFVYLKKQLKKLKVNFYGGSESNFIYIDLKNRNKTKKICRLLKAKKIIVRSELEKPFEKGFVLTGCPTKQMKKFVIAFTKIYT
jgi:histidinol-phosphate aminotransferase